MSPEVNIDNLKVGSCYKLKSNNTYLGRLTAEPVIMGIGDSRVTTAIFKRADKEEFVERWENDYQEKENYFIEVLCRAEGSEGGRRKTQRRRKTRRSKYSRRRKFYR